MNKVLLGGVAVTALVVAMGDGTRRAVAQSADTQRIEAIEKENAAMRLRLKRLEAETENAALHARLDRIDPQGRSAPRRLPSGSEPVMISPRDPALQDYAADMELKAPHRLPSWYSWTGLYVGGNAGYGIGNNRETQSTVAPFQTLNSFDDSVVAPKGITGGAQIGYNWQGGSNWLAGFEADFQGSSQKDTACGPICAFQTSPSGTLQTSAVINQELLYFGTFRGRVGFVNKDALFYVTGGGAWGRVRESVAFTNIVSGTPATIASNQVSSDQFGWVMGGGIEGALWGNWTAKAEYLYMDLGRLSSSFDATIFSGVSSGPITVGTTSAIRDHIVRVGLNYRLAGGMAGSSAMAYARDGMQDYASDRAPRMLSDAMYSWTGLYVGVNVGYGSGNDRTAATWDEGGSNIFHIVPVADGVVAPSGVIGGAQIGYNWQGGANWLVGFEADLQGSNQKDTACATPICVNGSTPSQPGIAEAESIEQELSYFATFRGRAGLVRNGVLLYVTGGGAWARVNETDSFTLNSGSNSTTSPTIASSQTSQNKVGWVAGAGIEGALWGNWSAKAEYLFMDLGAISNTFNFPFNVTPGVINPFTVATSSTIRDHIFRAGVNYRLDGGM